MPDWEAHAQGHRRANWVSLRTLRQRPKPAGSTDQGDPIFEVRSVRLVLRGEASHFNRLVRCSKCDREVAGSPVFTPDDLDRTPSPVICQACVRGSSIDTAWRPPGPSQRVSESVAAAPAAASQEPQEPQAQSDDLARELAHRPTEEAIRRLVATAVREALDEARAEMAKVAESAVTDAQAELRAELLGLVELIDAQRSEVAALGASLAGARTQMERLRDHPARPGVPDAASLDELRADVAALAQGQAAASNREQDLQRAISRLSALVATLRSDVDGVKAQAAQQATFQRTLEALTAAIQAGESRLNAFEQRMLDELRRIDAQLETSRPALRRPARTDSTLMDTLDAQLEAAESRLAARASTPRIDSLIEPAPAHQGERAEG